MQAATSTPPCSAIMENGAKGNLVGNRLRVWERNGSQPNENQIAVGPKRDHPTNCEHRQRSEDGHDGRLGRQLHTLAACTTATHGLCASIELKPEFSVGYGAAQSAAPMPQDKSYECLLTSANHLEDQRRASENVSPICSTSNWVPRTGARKPVAHDAHLTTRFTALPGTTITLAKVFPSALANLPRQPMPQLQLPCITAATHHRHQLPLIWHRSSSFVFFGQRDFFGHGARSTEPASPSSSTKLCGEIGRA